MFAKRPPSTQATRTQASHARRTQAHLERQDAALHETELHPDLRVCVSVRFVARELARVDLRLLCSPQLRRG